MATQTLHRGRLIDHVQLVVAEASGGGAFWRRGYFSTTIIMSYLD